MISAKKCYQPKTTAALSPQEELADYVVTEAQACCNFVLFQMTYLPREFIITKQQLRKESQSSQSSFRFLLENKKNNQHIAIKQFLYDWAPSAYDYPCLWLNTETFSSNDILAPRSVLVANRVLWIGKNYRGKNAAIIDLPALARVASDLLSNLKAQWPTTTFMDYYPVFKGYDEK